jgi:hypothetical protein
MVGMLREYHASHLAFDCLWSQFKLPVFLFCNILKRPFVHFDLLEMFRLSFSRNGGLPQLHLPFVRLCSTSQSSSLISIFNASMPILVLTSTVLEIPSNPDFPFVLCVYSSYPQFSST